MKKIKIKNFCISDNSKTFIVAEIGINHNRDINLAKKMIIKAKQCGADAVKFQVYNTDLFINKRYAKKQYQLFKKYEFSFDVFKKIKEFCDKNKIIFFASPFDIKSAEFLFNLKVPVLKIASGELSNISFVKLLAGYKLPLFISTGLHDFNEIKKVIKEIEVINNKIVIFYCISEYPLINENANLNVLKLYSEYFNHFIGFSDHSEGWFLDVMAVCLGVKVIEKHFTLDKKLPGPDHKISLDPADFHDMVLKIRLSEKTLGKKIKSITKMESRIRAGSIKGIYAGNNIKKGEKFSLKNLALQRPINRFNADKIFTIINKKAKKKYSMLDPI